MRSSVEGAVPLRFRLSEKRRVKHPTCGSAFDIALSLSVGEGAGFGGSSVDSQGLGRREKGTGAVLTEDRLPPRTSEDEVIVLSPKRPYNSLYAPCATASIVKWFNDHFTTRGSTPTAAHYHSVHGSMHIPV